MPIHFIVQGDPVPQGSMIARLTKAGTPFVMASNDKKLRKWRKAVAAAAKKAYGDQPLIDEPVMIQMSFWRPAPASKAGQLYDDTGPDLDKLERAINDGITGVILKNDARVVRSISRKCLTVPGVTGYAEVTITKLKRPYEGQHA